MEAKEEMRYGEIYCIRWNGGSYVGQTKRISMNRWFTHISLLKQGKHHNKSLQEAFYAVGLCGLSFSVLEAGIHPNDLDTREALWTDQLGSVNSRPRAIVKSDKTEKVLELIRLHKTYRDISSELGISLGSISSIVRLSRYCTPTSH
jgi:hypothetical protein